MKPCVRTQNGRKDHILYRTSRFTPGMAIANCGKVGFLAPARTAQDNWCKHCLKGPTAFVVRSDPRRVQ